MEISIILRPITDSKAIVYFINMLSASFDMKWQLIIPSFESDAEETVDFSPYADKLTIVTCGENEYLFQASQLALSNFIMVASVNNQYVFDIYAEHNDAEIYVINSVDSDDEERDFINVEDIVGGLLTHLSPLNRCIIKTDLFRSKVTQNVVWDSVYENLLTSELMLAAKSVEICKSVHISDFQPIRAVYKADDILMHSELIAKLLSAVDKERIFYMISDYFTPIFRDAENGRISRKGFEFIKSFTSIVLPDESNQRLLDEISGYDINESLQFGYYYFAAFVAGRASIEDKKIQNIQRKINSQTKKIDNIDITIKTIMKCLDTIQSTQKKLDKSLKTLDEKAQKMSKSLKTLDEKAQKMSKSIDSCKKILNRPDTLTLSDNFFYLSETLATLYEQCKNIASMLEKRNE